MNYLAYQHPAYPPSYTHHGLLVYPDSQMQQQMYSMQHQPNAMSQLAMEHQAVDKNDTKPRLAKHEVELLERHFQENHKPPSSVKRNLAEQMGVDVSRINNWFQNRRAKAKQEKKQLEYDLRSTGAQPYSEPSSPEFFNPSGLYADDAFTTPQLPMAPYTVMDGPPAPPVASINPQYENPAAASIESLHRTIYTAEAAAKRGDFETEFPEQPVTAQFSGPLEYNHPVMGDRAPFPAPTATLPGHFDLNETIFPNNPMFQMEAANSQPMVFQNSAPHTYGGFVSVHEDDHVSNDGSMMTYPSQLLSEGQGQHGFSSPPFHGQAFITGNADEIQSSEEKPDMRLKSPPPPANIASRRSQPRPAPLGAIPSRDKPSMPAMGARTISQSVLPRRLNKTTPEMRRVVSVGANLNVIGGRIQKSFTQLPQRSPLQRHFSTDCHKFFEQNAHNVKQLSLTAASPANNGLAPPTPNSPRDRARMQHEEESSISGSQSESDLDQQSFIFDESVPGLFTAPLAMTMASPPETPHHFQGGPRWGFDVSDDTIHTPGFGCFPSDFQLPMPQYVGPSQPATPAFGHFNGFPTHDSPNFDIYTVDKSVSEYSFPSEASSQYPMVVSSPEQQKQKPLTFHNATPADFEGKATP